MREITVQVFTFSELTEKAKEHAKQEYAAAFGYIFSDDALASLNKLAEHFNGKLANYSIDFFATSHSSAEFSMPDSDELTETEIGELLEQLGEYNPETLRGNGDCKLTGYCADEDAIDGFRAAWFAGERDINRLMERAFRNWLKSAQSDCESNYEDERFGETCEANEWEFFANGDIAR